MSEHSGLLTDLYELTMAAGYVQTGLRARATFELFVRNLPSRRSFLVVAGLEQVLEHLEKVRFHSTEIHFLRGHPAFAHVGRKFFDYLADFRFRGDLWAMPEGTLAFPNEPLLRVTAPIAEAQLLETYLLAAVHFQTVIASKAARVVLAAQGRPVIEFGSRRAHGIEAGVLAARAAFLAGCRGTSNVYAGRRFDIPTFGTQAHSWIMAHPDERQAFRRFLDIFPQTATLLVDTYDVRRAVNAIIALGRKPAAVRLDSGDLVRDSRWVRRRLDRVGWRDVNVFASGDLDEYRVAALLRRGARIDGFGVGTALATSSDSPALGVIYKLVELRRGRQVREAAKFSRAKVTYPGQKQVFRQTDREGKYCGDMIALQDERPGGVPLLVEAMRAGKRILPPVDLAEARRWCLEQLDRLPKPLRRLDAEDTYPVRVSPGLEKLFRRVRRAHRVGGSAMR